MQPAPYQAFFGHVVAVVPAGSGVRRPARRTDGGWRSRRPRQPRDACRSSLPRRDATLRLVAVGGAGKRTTSRPGRPGLRAAAARAAPRLTASIEDPALSTAREDARAEAFPGTAGVFVQDLVTGRGAAWNARARFPAASTLKLAIAVETSRVGCAAPPAHGSRLDGLMRSMLIYSDNRAANRARDLLRRLDERRLGEGQRDDEGGRARRQRDVRRVRDRGTRASSRAIPIRVESQPAIARTKYTTAWDLGRLIRYVHLAAGGTRAARAPDRRASRRPRRATSSTSSSTSSTTASSIVSCPATPCAGPQGRLDHHRLGTTTASSTGRVAPSSPPSWRGHRAASASSADLLAGRVAHAALDRFRALKR